MKEALKALAGWHSDKLKADMEFYTIMCGVNDTEQEAVLAAVEGILAGRPTRKERTPKKPKAAPAAKAA